MTRYRSFAPSTGAFILKPEENEKSEPFSNRKQVRIFLVWWARVDSNHRSWKAADLQSVPIGHSGTRPYSIRSLTDCLYILPLGQGFVNVFWGNFLAADGSKWKAPGSRRPGACWSWWQELNTFRHFSERKMHKKHTLKMFRTLNYFGIRKKYWCIPNSVLFCRQCLFHNPK